MPVYEYECGQCGQIQEAFQKISDPPLEVCDQCKGRLSKLISHSTFHLKGSGWYVTDYGKGDSKSSGKSTSPASTNSKSTDSKKTSASTQES
ncbi:MAG: zinc ribbon domain-containing protein [Desulfobacteraceae bacterium]|nr:MAG: zinc ribbon domain-containing protein [Desulfobacteraceae bacterium]